MGRPVKIHNKFGSVSKFISIDPRGFFVSAFIAHPADKVLKFAVTSVVNLGVKDVRNLESGWSAIMRGRGMG